MKGLRGGRTRCKTVAFRVDVGTAERIDRLARLSGLSKQDYLAARALDESVVVLPSSRTLKALSDLAEEIYRELLDARHCGRAVGGGVEWSLLTFSSMLRGSLRGVPRDMDAEIGAWERE